MCWDPDQKAPIANFPEAIRQAHRHCSQHREEILASDQCGCFYCCAIYPPAEIVTWIDNNQTALCPRCGIDSVIGSRSGYPITRQFLREMKRYWF